MDRTIAGLIEDLRSGDDERASRARAAIEALGPAALHPFSDALTSSHEPVRAAAIAVVARHGDRGAPTLREILRGAQANLRTFEDPSRAAEVHEAVMELEEPLAALVPGLLAELRSADPAVHRAAARDLETITHYLGAAGAEEEEILAALDAAAGDDCAFVRSTAAAALANLAFAGDRSVPTLAVLCDDPVAAVRWAAAEALGKLGADGAGGTDALLARVRDPETPVVHCAIRALGMIGSPGGGVLEALVGAMAHPVPEIRVAAAGALAAVQAVAREAIEALQAAAEKDADEEVRKAAAGALEWIRRRHGSV